ncbi:SpoIIE family protein phosphatase [Streptomyces sp. NPDC051985]|uniref:SpoIIE family protein phosphatase n=1 Tax=Streptomyces sp. NPDC051985 TaxID=3155807 RepID=UPI00341B651A
MSFDHAPPGWLFSGAMAALESEAAKGPMEAAAQTYDHNVLRQVLEGTSAAIAIMDEGLRFRYVNPAMARMSGVPCDMFRGRTMPEVLPGIRRSEEVLRMVLGDGRPRALSVTGTTPAPSPFPRRQWSAVYHRLEEDGQVLGLCGIAVETSGLRQHIDDLEKAHQRLALLDTAATRVGTTLCVERTCTELAEFVVPGLADESSVWTLEEQSPDAPPPVLGVLRQRLAAFAGGPDIRRRMKMITRERDYFELTRDSLARRCLDTGRPWLGNVAADEAVRKMVGPSILTVLRDAGIHSVLVVPLPTRGRPVGVIYLCRSDDSAPFTDEDVTVAQELASRAAVAIDNARQYTLEHTMALELQRALTSEPGTPNPGIDMATRYLPAGHRALVGGDWFDSITLASGRTLQVVGDVMGHGFTAAVAMSQYRSLIRTIAAADVPPERILAEADHRLATIGIERMATCLLALIDPAERICTMSSAGHLPPVHLRPDGRADLVPVPTGPPLGTDLGTYEALTIPVPPATTLLMYTDGLIEQRGTDIDTSLERLTRLYLAADCPLEHLLDTLLTRLVHGQAEDDVTLLASRLRTA